MDEEKKKPSAVNTTEKKPGLNCGQEQIADWLKDLHFKKQLFGGVNEADVWKKLDELNDLYNSALLAERARFDALLDTVKKELYAKLMSNGRQ